MRLTSHITTILTFLFPLYATILFAQQAAPDKVQVSIQVREAVSRKITPVMIAITHVEDSIVYTPPHGNVAEAPSYPNIFFEGIPFQNDKTWRGPVRKMSGAGAVNGQRTYVYGNAPTLPYWQEPVMYQVSGDFTIALFPGKWRISIQHGNEFIPLQEEFEISSQQKNIQKNFVLQRWINLPAMGWFSGDVHSHHPTDQPEFADYMLQMAKAEDVHMVNLLEMGDRKNIAFKARGFGEKYSLCKENICLAFGQEDPRSDYGHIIGLNIAALARDTAHYNYYDLVFQKLHKKPNALVGFAHFAYRGEGVTKGMALYAPGSTIDFVELLQNTQINTPDYYDYLNMGFRIAAAAGSDFPWGSTIGDCRTFVYTGQNFSPEAWFNGLKAGHSFVSNGPALFLEVDGKMPGMEVHQRLGSKVELQIKAISNSTIGNIDRIEIHNNDGLVLSQKNIHHSDSVLVAVPLTLHKSQWITAAVYCDNGAVAHTSAVYCVVDGQPVLDKVKAPGIIQKQLSLLQEIKTEERLKETTDEGIMERVSEAERFYKKLLQQTISAK